MTPEPASLCVSCGSKTVRKRGRPGRTASYRNMPALPVPAHFPIPTCSRCRKEFIDPQTASELDGVLRELYRSSLKARVRRAIDQLMEVISQRRLEMLLGLSQGYLSRLRAGDGTPSPELVNHLALIARDPRARLKEIEGYWALSDEPESKQAERPAVDEGRQPRLAPVATAARQGPSWGQKERTLSSDK